MASFAATYYVSNAGDDANSGLTEELAWKTLTKVNAATFSAGDQILFKRGDTFYGTLTIHQSGTSGNPITYGAYGTGENPILTGFTSITSWTDLGNNIWESTNAVSTLSTCNMLVINGANTPMGRTPNSGYYYFQSHSDDYHITSNNLTGTPNWTGAELALNINNWETKRVPITAQSGGTLKFTQPESFSIRQDDLKFIIQSDTRTLDQQNEWYYNPSTKKISVYSSTEPSGVKVSTVSTLVSVSSKNYVTFENIEFTGSNEKTISISNSNNITVDNCDFNYSGLDAIYGSQVGTSENLVVQYCTFNNSNNGAIGVDNEFPNAIIANNIVTYIGLIYGANRVLLSGTNNSSRLSGITAKGSGTIIEHNTVTNIGYRGIDYLGSNTTVRYNYIEHYCQINHDGGGIYTWNTSNATYRSTGIYTPYSGTKVYNNIVIGDTKVKEPGHLITTDAGIYLDGNSNGIEVYNNTVEFPIGDGFRVNGNHNVDVHHNNIFNTSYGIRFRHEYISNVSATYNTVIAKNSNQYVYMVDPAESVINIITADFNVLDRPIDSDNIFELIIRVPFGHPFYSLSEWQSYSGQDANSHKCPVSITSESDLQFEYNASDFVKTIPLSNPMIDVNGTKYAFQLTLQPYSSIILIKDPNPASVSSNLKEAVPIDVFPNPSQGKVTVRFSDLPDMGSRIDILDITGRKVASQIITGTVEEFNLNQLPSGIYMVKSTLGSDVSITKLIVEK